MAITDELSIPVNPILFEKSDIVGIVKYGESDEPGVWVNSKYSVKLHKLISCFFIKYYVT